MKNVGRLLKTGGLMAAFVMMTLGAGCISVQRQYYQCPKGEECFHQAPTQTAGERATEIRQR